MAFNLTLNRTALLVIDFQADTFAGKTLRVVGAEDVIPKSKKILVAARRLKLPIIHTKEVHRKEMVDFGRELDGAEPIHCLETSPGTDFHQDLAPIDGEFVITKRRYSCFFATDLEILLRGLQINTLVIMGTLTDVCVHYTVVDAHQRDYRFYTIEDCCMGSGWEAHWAALCAMEYLQRESRISCEEFIQATNNLSRSSSLLSEHKATGTPAS